MNKSSTNTVWLWLGAFSALLLLWLSLGVLI
jgi:hypothetical protein